MQRVTIEFHDETVESLDRVAAMEYGGDREAAARALLDEWLDEG